MEHTPEETHHVAHTVKTTPKDFFLWLGAILALYGSITAFFSLIFAYINIAFPDALTFRSDAYVDTIRIAMATVIVLTPVMLGALLTIRRDIVRTPGKSQIWVRRWALVLTIFLATATAAVTLITLVTTFLGGEITVRFGLKASVVLLIAVLVALHFTADLKGYWTLHREKVNLIGAAVGAMILMTIIAGFLIIGSPSHIRAVRIDQQRVTDLQTIQYSITNYWQQKQSLPPSLDVLNNPLSGTVIPTDPETGIAYDYQKESATSFELCATFTANSDVVSGVPGSAPVYPAGAGMDSSFIHGIGKTCFVRTIDPELFPAFSPVRNKI